MERSAKKKKAPRPSGPASSIECRLVETFWGFWPAFQRWADSRAPEGGLTPQRARILAYLHDRGPSIMSELKTRLGVTATNITALVDALEKEGLLRRRPHPNDRRATLLELTPKASRGLTRDCEGYRDRVGELFSNLPDSDQKELLRILVTLRTRLDRTT